MRNGFDNDKYLKIQSEHIKERIAKFGNKLYLEFGGKLFDDYHASRVLPGFQPDSKLRMLMQLADYAEIVIVISATDIEKNKIRGDLGITYDMDVLRLRDEFQSRGLMVSSVVITHYKGQGAADVFRAKLEKLHIKTYIHYNIEGYPSNIALIDSDDEISAAIDKIDKYSNKYDVNFVISISRNKDELPRKLQDKVIVSL